MKIGITERGDAGKNTTWVKKINSCAGAILITKSLSPLFIAETTIRNCIVHATITGLGGTAYEPNVMPWEKAATLFKHLIGLIGQERVVLRIDPIIPSQWEKAYEVYKTLHLDLPDAFKTRVRISFLDLYQHVIHRFKAAGITPESYNSFHKCLAVKTELLENKHQCENRCLYCYWN